MSGASARGAPGCFHWRPPETCRMAHEPVNGFKEIHIVKDWRLSTKLWLIVGLTWFVGCAIATVLFFRVSGVAASYDDLLNTVIAQRVKARVLDGKLTMQIQLFNQLLVRGQDPTDRAKYAQGYQREASEIKLLAHELNLMVTDPTIK